MTRSTAASLLPLVLLAGCSLAPHYARPSLPTPVPPTWKTAPGWQQAVPADGAPRSDWWKGFGDPMLDDLVVRAIAHNQTLAQAAATYREAIATTREARASLFPTIGANGTVTHTHSGSGSVINGDTISSTSSSSGTTGTTGTGTATGTGTTGSTTTGTVSRGSSSTNYHLDLQASWTPDLFGSALNTERDARLTEQARLADLANARLALEGELVTDYLGLRAADAQIASLEATDAAYERSLKIATNQYNAGIVARTDVFQAQSQLASAQSSLEGEKQTRAQFEDAIAVYIGENPASFTIAPLGMAWTPVVPDVPVSLPSTLVERRPDVASAERQVAAANAEIGVAKAAFFPTVGLSASGGFENNSLSGLFTSAATLWSLGAQVAETLIDFGARQAKLAAARAAYDATVANYRQVTLTAFQNVQDELVALQILARQEVLLRQASIAADKSEASIRNEYQAGTVVYTDVVTAQATALTARRALIQAQVDHQTAAAALIQALGGGWSDADITQRTLAQREAASKP